MANDTATVWGGQIVLGRKPASSELLVGDANGNFALTPSSSVLPAANIQTLLDGITSTQGSVLYRSATAWTGLGPGTAGQVLTTNGAAANPSWAAGNPWTEVIKTADSTNATTTLAAATGLSFSAAAGVYYSFEIGIIMEVVASSGLKIAISTPNGSLRWAPGNNNTSGGTTSNASVIIIPASVASISTFSATILGYFNCTSLGTVQVQFAQQATVATAVTIFKGSWLRYRTV